MEILLSLQLNLTAWLVCAWICVPGIVAYGVLQMNRPWVVRITVLALAMTPVLLVGASEIFWMLVLSAVLTVALISVVRRLRSRRAQVVENGRLRHKFSLGKAFLLTAVLACAAAIALKTPALNVRTWVSLLLVASLASATSSAAYYRARGKPGWALSVCVFCLGAVVSVIPLVIYDFVLISFTGFLGWPVDLLALTWGFPGPLPQLPPRWHWFAIGPVVMFCLLPWATTVPSRRSRGQCVLRVLSCFVIVPPLLFSLQLLYVPEFPDRGDEENVYPQLVEMGKAVESSRFSVAYGATVPWDSLTLAARKDMLDDIPVDFDALVELLDHPMRAPVDFHMEELDVLGIMGLRASTRALVEHGRLGHGGLRPEEYCLSAVRLGVRSRRGGVLIQHLAGTACSGIGLSEIYAQRGTLSDQSAKQLIASLLKLESQIDPLHTVLDTERIWMMRQGWHNQISVLLSELAGESIVSMHREFLEINWRTERTRMHLLAAQLAIEGYRIDTGEFPAALSDLVPEWLSVVPQDFFTSNASELRYKSLDTSYVLYSVGIDGVDDGGYVPDAFLGMPQPTSGDLRLDKLYDDAAASQSAPY